MVGIHLGVELVLQVPVHQRPHGRHADGARAVNGNGRYVRFLTPPLRVALYGGDGTLPHPPAPWLTSQGVEAGRCVAMSQARVQQRGAVRRPGQRGQRRHVVLWLPWRHQRHRAGDNWVRHHLSELSAASTAIAAAFAVYRDKYVRTPARLLFAVFAYAYEESSERSERRC